jgi:hypothetical protein
MLYRQRKLHPCRTTLLPLKERAYTSRHGTRLTVSVALAVYRAHPPFERYKNPVLLRQLFPVLSPSYICSRQLHSNQHTSTKDIPLEYQDSTQTQHSSPPSSQQQTNHEIQPPFAYSSQTKASLLPRSPTQFSLSLENPVRCLPVPIHLLRHLEASHPYSITSPTLGLFNNQTPTLTHIPT